MRPPSSVEQPTAAKMSATKASSAFALMVTVISGLAAVQAGDVAAVPGGRDPDLVDADVRGQAGDVANEITHVLRLRHALALGRRDRHRPLVEDRRRHLARQYHA